MSALRSRPLAFRGAAVLTAVFAVFAVLGTWGAAPADATSYRFWSYWLGSDDGWAFSSQGASRRPADGTVDGWRFAISEASSSTTTPRHSPSFARICGSTDPVDGNKRVGVVIDFGTTADAPDGDTPGALISRCVVAPEDANGYDVLAAVVALRSDGGLICGMNGYPATECGAVVADPTTSPSTDPTNDGGGGNGNGTTPPTGDLEGGASGGGGGAVGSGSSGGAGSGSGSEVDDTMNSRSESDDDREGKDTENGPAQPTPAETTVAASAAAAGVSTTDAGSPIGLVIGVSVVGALLATAYLLRRRRA